MKSYLVGGAVRDTLMGLNPKDRDWVVVGATSEEMLSLGFSQVGADFPVFLHPETGEEYALARTERKTGNGYHGFTTDFNPNVTLYEDLARRDLTINSMAMDVGTGEIFDPFNGRQDLEKKILRHTTVAFAEDPLRVIRLARFFARYEFFTVDPMTEDLCQDLCNEGALDHLSSERFWAELQKVFTEHHPERFFTFLYYCDALERVDFFRKVFGFRLNDTVHNQPLLGQVRDTAKSMAEQLVNPGERFMHFIGATAKDYSPGGDTRAYTIRDNLRRFYQRASSSPEAIYTIMLQAKAWSEGSTYTDFVNALLLGEGRRNLLVSDGMVMAKLRNKTQKVKAADFPGVEGKALGEAIKAARIEIIEEVLDSINF